jgi:hypothetical protein
MALPGITKVRAQAREADNLCLIARADLTTFIRVIAGEHPTDRPSLVTALFAADLIKFATHVIDLDREAKRLWDEVAFMEET